MGRAGGLRESGPRRGMLPARDSAICVQVHSVKGHGRRGGAGNLPGVRAAAEEAGAAGDAAGGGQRHRDAGGPRG
eukprot:CAMPEP_0117679552 /NCGR_PEP_ID=MMETSP0804-20121206/17873_1 /TAXON_ID=1074897 /ORGANISM="Tetraselmis astigmatica, Strain CCMP880" /LENGTH=74 /DNA_ID=CAMNT_0005488977 /DNA_START=825 /DNA_END=1046 /DNA_ORIENTATION=-